MSYYKTNYLFFFIALLLVSACSNLSSTSESDTVALEKSYTNAKYDITLRSPEQWVIIEQTDLQIGEYAINVFKRGTGAERELPLAIHNSMKHSFVAIWPRGLGTELPYGQYVSLNETDNAPELQFPVNKEESNLLLLKNGAVWAYFIVPKNPPAGWQKFGFIFAQVRTSNTSAKCFDKQTGKRIPVDQCNFLTGDPYVRTGDIDEQDAVVIRKILKSINLQKVVKKVWAGDLIEVEKPLPNIDITSPLTVKGKAKGFWYFEGIFTVKLYDGYGNLLAENQAKAQEKWMTEKFVPFEVTLKFDAPSDQRGSLVFQKANPSGLDKNAMSYSVPVIFPPSD